MWPGAGARERRRGGAARGRGRIRSWRHCWRRWIWRRQRWRWAWMIWREERTSRAMIRGGCEGRNEHPACGQGASGITYISDAPLPPAGGDLRMARVKYEAGMIVEHPNRPDWGPGKILSVTNDTLAVRWRDVQVAAAADQVK